MYRQFHWPSLRDLASIRCVLWIKGPPATPDAFLRSSLCSVSVSLLTPSCTLSLPSQLFLCSLPVCLSTCPLVCLYPFPKYPLLFPSPINLFYPRSIVWDNFLGVHLGMDPSKVPPDTCCFFKSQQYMFRLLSERSCLWLRVMALYENSIGMITPRQGQK